ESRRVAGALLRLGVHRGDVVAAVIGNRAEWVSTCFGAARIGAVFAPLNTWYRRGEIGWALRHLDAKALISETRFLKHDYAEDLAAIALELRRAEPGQLRSQALPSLRTVVHIGERRPGAFTWEEFLRIGEGAGEEVERAQAAVQ